MLKRAPIAHGWITLMLSMPALLIGPAAPARPATDAVVAPPCGETEFDAALLTAQSSVAGGTITFQCSGPTTITFSSIKIIGGKVVIDGGTPGAITLSGGNTTGLFLVDVGDLTLLNLALANASASQQGAIAVAPSGRLTLNDCTLTNNGAVGHGGGAIDSSGALTVTNCTLTNNHADFGGAININPNATALISGTTFLGNAAQASGGGLYNLGDVFVVNAYFAHNTAATGDGGGLWTGNHLLMDGSTFYSNTAASGYGGALYTQGPLMVTNSRLRANAAEKGGGGIQTFMGTTTLNNVIVADNSVSLADGAGGGLLNSQGQLSVENSTLSGNRAAAGGAIANYGGVVSLSGATLSGNTAAVAGGGIHNESGDVYLTNVTLSGNAASGAGGLGNYNGTAFLTNVTLSGNTASSLGGGLLNSFGSPHLHLFNVLVADSPAGDNCFFGTAPDHSESNQSSDSTCAFGAGRDGVSAMLAPLGSYGGPTLSEIPLPGSPALDNGANADCPPTDQRGQPRPINAVCDVGAVERQLVDFGHFAYLPLIER